MSTWITPAGTLGNYTEGQSLNITLSATPSLGGTITYVLANATTLPPGLTLNYYTGTISGISGYVPINTLFNFQVSATETVNGVDNLNIRNFSITVTSLTWVTPAGSIGVFAENSAINYQFSATPSQNTNTVTYSILNGSLPVGTVSPVTLSSGGLLSGTPNSIVSNTTYTFTIRASEYNGTALVEIKDRTFTLTVQLQASSVPQFTTPQGALFTALDSTWQDFQIQYTNPDVSLVPIISVVIGALPAGLQISPAGLIRGWPEPPVDANNNPITLTSTFTLEISTAAGSSLAQYTITIKNQQLTPGFVGRAPAILNTQPLSFIISPSDPYAAYYFSGSNIGDYLQNTDFIFKVIGHNFDSANSETDLVYEINGLFGGGGVNQSTGWINTLLPTIGPIVETFNFTARVYRRSNPSLTSGTLFLTATLIGDIDTRIVWVSNSNLGTINNGAVSDLSVVATAESGQALNYRIISTRFPDYNFKTIVYDGIQFNAFGDKGVYVIGSTDGGTWTAAQSITNSVTFLYFNDAVLDTNTSSLVLVGYNQTNSAIIYTVPIETTNYTPSGVATGNILNAVAINSTTYVAVGNNGTITTTSNPATWSTIATSGTTNNLRGICHGNSLFVVVGEAGTILTSPDAVTWTSRLSGTTNQLNSVVFDGTNFIAVGDLGTILTSPDAIAWTTNSGIDQTYNFTSVAFGVTGTMPNQIFTAIACGLNGIVSASFDHGATWTTVQNLISTSNLYSVIYDGTAGVQSFFIVGDGGMVLRYYNASSSANYRKLLSPTVASLPPDLTLTVEGDIVGRLAFESTGTIQPQGNQITYSFTVQVYNPSQNQISNQKTFTLTTVQEFYLPYDNVYIKALLTLPDRVKINELLSNTSIIPTASVYRAEDPYFGISTGVTFEHIYGVPSVANSSFYQTYINAVQLNHYWRNVVLGEIKTASAVDSTGTVIYEVVYSQIIDDLVNAQGLSIPKQITWPRTINLALNNWITSLTTSFTSQTFIPGTQIVKTVTTGATGTTFILNNIADLTVGMNVFATANQTALTPASNGAPPVITSIDTTNSTVTLSVTQTLATDQQLLFAKPLFDSLTPGTAQVLYPNSLQNMRQQIYNAIGRVNNTSILPLWMTCVQPGTEGYVIGYTPAWVICYTKPGYSKTVANNINMLWPYKLNAIDFELDRFEVDRSKTYNYLGTNNQGVPLWNTLPSAQPDVINDSADSYIYFPRRTILPNTTQ